MNNRWFLEDLGARSALFVVGCYVASWLLLVVAGGFTRAGALHGRTIAGTYYSLVSLKVLAHDASVLAQAWGVALFAASTALFVFAMLRFERTARSDLAWFVGVAGYHGLLLNLEYLWSSNGGRIVEFLRSGSVLAVFGAWALVVLALVHALKLRRLRVGIGLLGIGVPFLTSLLLSRRAVAHARPPASALPDVYVFSVDALRKDVFDDWCQSGSADITDVICRRAKRYDAVVTNGISTYQVLTRNLGLEADCKRSLLGRLRARNYLTSMYLGRKGKRIEGTGCFDRYFSGTGQTLAEQYALPALFEELADSEASSFRGKYIDTAEMIERFSREEASSEHPLFVYFHVLDLHGPYVPSSLSNDAEHLADVREFVQNCYWKACDLSVLRNRQLVQRMKSAYLLGVADVERHVRSLLAVIATRGRPYVLVLTSDHGELFGEHQGINHSGGFVQELLSVPFSVHTSSGGESPGRDCALRLSSEVLAEVLKVKSGQPQPGGKRTLEAPPLGVAVIDSEQGLIHYRVNDAMARERGTWRNVHASASGTVPFAPACEPASTN